MGLSSNGYCEYYYNCLLRLGFSTVLPNKIEIMRRIKLLVWTLPVQCFLLLGAICVIFESCSIPVEVRPEGRYINVKELYTPFIACGIVLLIGTGFSIFNFIQIGKISRKLKEIGYSI